MMRRLDKVLNRSVSDTQKLRQKNTKLFATNLNRFLEKHIPRIVKLGDTPDAAEAVAVLGGLNDGLIQAGLASVVDDIRGSYYDELAALSSRFKVSGFLDSFSLADKAVVDSLIDNDLKRVTKLLSPYVDDISSTLLRNVIGGQPIDVSALLDKTTDVLESQLQTEVDTMLSGFSRTVTANKASELGLDLFIYIGPDDKITRDFCDEVLSKDPPIYTREEISAMDNGQGLDAIIYCGGYNCRHQWAPISEEEARNMGWDGR